MAPQVIFISATTIDNYHSLLRIFPFIFYKRQNVVKYNSTVSDCSANKDGSSIKTTTGEKAVTLHDGLKRPFIAGHQNAAGNTQRFRGHEVCHVKVLVYKSQGPLPWISVLPPPLTRLIKHWENLPPAATSPVDWNTCSQGCWGSQKRQDMTQRPRDKSTWSPGILTKKSNAKPREKTWCTFGSNNFTPRFGGRKDKHINLWHYETHMHHEVECNRCMQFLS